MRLWTYGICESTVRDRGAAPDTVYINVWRRVMEQEGRGGGSEVVEYRSCGQPPAPQACCVAVRRELKSTAVARVNVVARPDDCEHGYRCCVKAGRPWWRLQLLVMSQQPGSGCLVGWRDWAARVLKETAARDGRRR